MLDMPLVFPQKNRGFLRKIVPLVFPQKVQQFAWSSLIFGAFVIIVVQRARDSELSDIVHPFLI